MTQELEPTAQLRAVEWFLAHRDQVMAALTAAYPGVDPELRHDAFIKGLLDIAQKPEALDPERGTVVELLIGASRRALRSLWRSDTSRQQRDGKKGRILVAERAAAARDVSDVLADDELAPLARAEIALTDEERRYLALWEQGVDDPAPLAQALGIEHLPPEQQEIETRRTHKRMMKRLERLRDRWADERGSP